jgi:hypothetical protein
MLGFHDGERSGRTQAASMTMADARRPMSAFDPSQPALVHDALNDPVFEWQPERCEAHFRKYGEQWCTDVVNWDGLLLDGWR